MATYQVTVNNHLLAALIELAREAAESYDSWLADEGAEKRIYGSVDAALNAERGRDHWETLRTAEHRLKSAQPAPRADMSWLEEEMSYRRRT